MTFRSIETLASDVLRKIEAGQFPLWIEPGEQASAMDSAQPAARRGFEADEHLSGGGEFARPALKGDSAELNGKSAATEAAASFREEQIRRGEALTCPPTTGREMATARRNERSTPRSAVVISLAMYRQQRHARSLSVAR